MDRRTTIKWMLAASASLPALKGAVVHAAQATGTAVTSTPYGTDPDLLKIYKPGDLWPLTLSSEQRVTAAALADLIIPADANSPSASKVGVVEFIDEWISAPYEEHRADRKIVLNGFEWLDKESARRFSRPFGALLIGQGRQICDDICYLPKAAPQFTEAAGFFARYRDLTAGGFYTTPEGRKDLQYVGNVPLARFDGPPAAVLKKAGLL
ncbi:gluconate 2-dehydrogenase subunit 3 family protein [Povalibacter sp.]|uniref:gluconate 2-dehydrogenase subunit 3 family protein n=1 Tax=Povalibacter sp. TaxID=1962978 RepID=UPI002F40CBC7